MSILTWQEHDDIVRHHQNHPELDVNSLNPDNHYQWEFPFHKCRKKYKNNIYTLPTRKLSPEIYQEFKNKVEYWILHPELIDDSIHIDQMAINLEYYKTYHYPD